MPDIQKQIEKIEKLLDESDEMIYNNVKDRYAHISTQDKIKDVVENTYLELKKIEPNEIAKLMKDDFYKQYLEREINTVYNIVERYLDNIKNHRIDANRKLIPLLQEFREKYPLITRNEYNKLLESKKIFEDKELEIQFNEILEQIDECDNLIYNNIKNSISHIDSPSKIKEVVENSYDYFKKTETNEIQKLMEDDAYKQYLEKEITIYLSLIIEYLHDMEDKKIDSKYTLNPLIAEYITKYPQLVNDDYNKLLESKKTQS
jgi:hypothetical protein